MRTVHRVDLTGDYETTIYDAARRLIAEGVNPRDEVQTFRDGVISMCGHIGWLAKWRVVFADDGPCLKRYCAPTLARLAAETAEEANPGMEGLTRPVADEMETA